MRPARLGTWPELGGFGITPLTGEADRFYLRMLCDLTAKGQELLSNFFGGHVTFGAPNWNGGDETNPHVASVLLPYDILTCLSVYILLLDFPCVGVSGDAVFGLDPETEEGQRYLNLEWDGKKFFDRVFRKIPGPGTADRMEHMMTGRTG